MTSRHVLLLVLLPAAGAGAADSIPFDLLPPGTRILVGCSVESLKTSPLLQGVGVSSGSLSGSLGTAAAPPGFNPLKDVDSIVFGAAGSKQDSPALAVLRGRFPAITPNATVYRGAQLLEDPRNPKYSLAVLDQGTAIVGAPAQVRAALDRRGRVSAPVSKIAARFLELGASSDLWGVGDVPEGLTAAGSAAMALQAIDRFEFASTLRDGLRFRAEIHSRTTGQASQMTASLQMIEAMLKGQTPAGGPKFDLRVENGSLVIELFVPEADLRKAMAAQKDQLAGMLQKGITMSRPGAAPAGFAPLGFPAIAGQPSVPVSPPLPSAGAPGSVVTNPRGETVTVVLPGPK